MFRVHIVSHVYAVELPQYAVFLRAQLSSFILNSPDVQKRITVCCTPEDTMVLRVIEDLRSLMDGRLDILSLSKGDLFRRCIGRNVVALHTDCDLVWFADVDYLFGLDCLSSLCSTWQSFEIKPVMVWPREVLIQSDFEKGDSFWSDNLNSGGLIGIHPGEFKSVVYNRAIGGVQIVDGNFSREHGYLNENRRWQSPVSPDRPFPSFRDDVRFRHFCETRGSSLPVSLQNLYRLRHTKVTYR